MKMLNLGCGNRIYQDAVNHDVVKHRPEIDLAFNLDVLPYPLKDKSFDKILMISVIEHLEPNAVLILNECWRILDDNGILELKYPLHTSPTIYDDPTHRHFYSARSFDYFDPRTTYGRQYGFYTPYKWHIIKKKLHKNMSQWLILRKVNHG